MPDLSHERERLYRLVDSFIDEYPKEHEFWDDSSDVRIDQAMIGAIIHFTTSNEEEHEVPLAAFETKRRFIQRGLVEEVLDGYVNSWE